MKKPGTPGTPGTKSKQNSNNECPVKTFDFTRQVPDDILESDEFDDQINKIVGTIKTDINDIAKDWSFQLEEAPTTGKLHFQGRLRLKNKTRKFTLCKTKPGYHWSVTATDNKNNFDYVVKLESRKAGPWRSNDKPPPFIPIQYQIPDWHPWQKSVVEKIEQPPDFRNLNVVIDPNGDHGKSTLIGNLASQGKVAKIPYCNDYRDIIRMVMNVDTSTCYFFDLPKAIKKDKLYGLYSAIEEIKGGFAYDDRHVYKSKWFNAPHIWVFTNTEPDLNLLSKGRWTLWQINEKLELVKYYRRVEVLQTPPIVNPIPDITPKKRGRPKKISIKQDHPTVLVPPHLINIEIFNDPAYITNITSSESEEYIDDGQVLEQNNSDESDESDKSDE